VIGPFLIVVVLLLISVGVLVAGGVAAAGLGFLLKHQVDQTYEGTEYAELS
jgi:hypothetical protein